MLLRIHPLLTPDLLHALASMGHGDEIAIVDANFPAFAVVRTGELRKYGNVLLVKGVVNHDPPA